MRSAQPFIYFHAQFQFFLCTHFFPLPAEGPAPQTHALQPEGTPPVEGLRLTSLHIHRPSDCSAGSSDPVHDAQATHREQGRSALLVEKLSASRGDRC